jgi:murein DD-endopeptidase MepM/ murein hydrolase activator NlpD
LLALAALAVFGGTLGWHSAHARVRRADAAQPAVASRPAPVATDKAPARETIHNPLPDPVSHGDAFVWPVIAPISSPFGPRAGSYHHGLDLAANAGTPIHAARSGTVLLAGVVTGYGNTVILKHPDGTRTLYGHCSKLLVHPGQLVGQGDVIGLVGSTGHSTGPHLHFEIIVNDKAQDPLVYLPER